MIDALITNSLKAGSTKWLERLPLQMTDRITADAVKWILAYTKKYGHPPTIERYNSEPHAIVGNAGFPKVPLEDLYDQSVTMLKREYTAQRLTEWRERVDLGEEIPLSDLSSLGNALAIPLSKEESDMSSLNGWEWIEEEGHKMTFGIATLDELIGGIDPGSLGVIAARPGIGKTQLLCHFTNNWYQQGKKVLFVSCEMQLKMIVARIHGIMAHTNPRTFLSGTAKDREFPMMEIDEINKAVKAMGGIMGLLPPPVFADDVKRHIAKHQFDVVIIDSFYRLKNKSVSDNEWNRVKALTDILRQITAEFNTTIIVSSQFKRTGKIQGYDLEDLAFSDSIGQDVDFALAICQPSKDAQVIEVIKNRNGSGFGNISFKYDWSASRIEETSWK